MGMWKERPMESICLLVQFQLVVQDVASNGKAVCPSVKNMAPDSKISRINTSKCTNECIPLWKSTLPLFVLMTTWSLSLFISLSLCGLLPYFSFLYFDFNYIMNLKNMVCYFIYWMICLDCLCKQRGGTFYFFLKKAGEGNHSNYNDINTV